MPGWTDCYDELRGHKKTKWEKAYETAGFCFVFLILLFEFFLIADMASADVVPETATIVSRSYTPTVKKKERRRHGKMSREEEVTYPEHWDITARTATWTWNLRVTQAEYEACAVGQPVVLMVEHGNWTGWMYKAKFGSTVQVEANAKQ
jgi:hypothetical protein